MAKPIYVLNGPNLNLLGTREPEIYGSRSLDDIASLCDAQARSLGQTVAFKQSNAEGELVDWVQEAREKAAGIVINAGAYTHTSVAIRDALIASDLPVIELHLSNVFARDRFRHHSYISDIARGVICGFGATGYQLALEAMSDILKN